MPTVQEQLLQIIANSKKVTELPEALGFSADDYIPIYNTSNQRLEKVKKSNIVFTGEPVTTITGLTDTPNSLIGQGSKILVVNAEQTAFEFKDLAQVQGVTSEIIANALGYTPANDSEVIKGVKKFDGTVLNPDSNRVITLPDFASEANTINITSITGWADYTDSTYTTASPFVVALNTKVNLPNDGINGVRSEMPLDINNFYDPATGKILGKNGDAYTLTLEFNVRPTSAASNVRLKTTIDIGGSVGEIYPRDFSLTKGIGNEHFYLSSFSFYTLNTFELNGGIIKVEAVNSEVEIYDIRYVFTRIHKAGNPRAQSSSLTIDELEAIAANPLLTAANPVVDLAKITPLAKTGTVLDLSKVVGNNYNYAAASAATTYTTTSPVINGYVKCLINAPSEPTVTGATKLTSSAAFLANTNMELVVESFDGTNVRYFFLAL